MLCTKCGNTILASDRFCPNCGALIRASGFKKASFDSQEKIAEKGNYQSDYMDHLYTPSQVVLNPYPENDPDRIREMIREENERTTYQNDARRWANVSFIMGLLSICFITAGVGIIAIVLALVFGSKSNKAADTIGIPRQKKAKTGMILACVPFMVAVLAGIVVGILALCGVFGG
jgi:hypothetical protein